jgi:Rrf2 family protein
MQFSIGVEYAFHSLFYMVDLPAGKTINIRDLARFNKISETYLSKAFTKLRKAGIVRSVPGVNGGHELAKAPADISFWDVIEAIEGASYCFQCAEVRKDNLLVDDPSVFSAKCPCLIKVVISESEEKMREYLRTKTLAWLHTTVSRDFSSKRKTAIKNWLANL